jgi:ATP-dependent RNA helicase DeaD
MKTFNDFPLHSKIISALKNQGITNPTEIQEKSLSILLENKNTDFHGQAQTGTGKTLAFGIPLVQSIDTKNKKTQALVVGPTRELVEQIYQSLKLVAEPLGISITTIYGGVSIERQLSELKRGVQIVVGTPGRLNDHLRRNTLKLDTIETVVLDEADIMLDMGFKEEVDEILTYAPKERAIWLFSATVKPGIKQIMKSHMSNPVHVSTSDQNITTPKTKQYVCTISSAARFEALCRFIASAPDFYGFLFCQTKIQTSEIAEKLIARGYKANALHGDMSQMNRNRVIRDFKNKRFNILVATDVAARGIDVADISHVINYQFPEDQESYVHRIGRTGRAGKEGTAITLITSRDARNLQEVARKFKLDIKPIEPPTVDAIIQQQVKKTQAFITQTIQEQKINDKPYVAQVQNMIQQFSAEELNSAMVSLLEDKFFNSIDTKELPKHKEQSGNQRGHAHGQFTELFINLGSQDGLTKKDIMSTLTANRTLKASQIAKVRVIKKRSFILIPSNQADTLIPHLAQQPIRGKRWRVIAD